MKLFITSIFLFIFLNSFAQFTLQGELRPRFELRDGYKTLRDTNSKPAAFVSQRTRLVFGYQKDKFSSKITLQDVRVWGDEKFKTDVASEALHEAWINMYLFDSLTLKVGRQELVYDNERLLSNNNWQQMAMSHDAALLKFKWNSWSLDLCGAFNQQSDSNNFGTDYLRADIKTNYKVLGFMWLTKKFNHLSLTAINITDGYQNTGGTKQTYYRSTYGPIINFKNSKLAIDVRGFLQTGRTQTGQGINSWFANTDINYSLTGKFNVLGGFELWSGYDYTDSTGKHNNAFDVLYGTGHKFNGNMDYFTRPTDTKNTGLLDVYLFLIYKNTAKISTRVDYHYFALENNYGKKGGSALDKYLGSEIDLSAKIDFNKEISLNFGYSTMFGTNSLVAIKTDKKKGISGGVASKFQSWVFVMLTAKPVFYK